MRGEQCDEPMCTLDGVVYGQCVGHAPPAWLRQVLDHDRDLLTDEQIEQAKSRLEKEEGETTEGSRTSRGVVPQTQSDPLRDTPVVMLSIDNQWAEAILNGDKLFEYRRQPPAMETPYRIVLYAKGDVGAVVGGVETHTVVEAPVDELIDKTVQSTPHDPDELRSYFEGKEQGAAIRIDTFIKYDEPVGVDELREVAPEFSVPQNFRYLRPDDDVHAQILQQLPFDRGIPYER